MKLKNKFKNKLFHLIIELGFSPSLFQFFENPSDNLTITYNKTPLIFTIRESPDEFDKFDSYYTTFTRSYFTSDYFPKDSYDEFNYIVTNFRTWIDFEIKKYNDAQEDEEDLWSEYLNGTEIINFKEVSFDNKSNFNIAEQKLVRIAINELKFLIETNITVSIQQQEIISERLNYLIDNTDRLNKFEWKSLVLTTLISISITLSLDVEKGNLLFEYLKRVFNSFPKLI